MRERLDRGLRLLSCVSLITLFGCVAVQAQESQAGAGEKVKPPYNIIFVIVDQRAYKLPAASDYDLPGFDAIARHGVSFNNHYISTAMCSPSRASFYTGQPPR
jgi:hypothetical protein